MQFILKTNTMSRICQITGKKVMFGNNVSHSNKKTKRKFYPNLFQKKYYLASEKRWLRINISASGMRTVNKLGFEKAIEEAKRKGYYIPKKVKN